MTSKNNPALAIVGSQSMVGSRFCELSQNDFDLVKADLNGQIPVDITASQSTENLFKNNNFQTLILFSAFTAVDGAEAQRNDKNGICWKINVEGVQNIVQNCQKYNRKLILISTDFVFDGQNGPYSETDTPAQNPDMVSWYGLTKFESEKAAQKLDSSIILRIAYPYRNKFDQKDDMIRKVLKSYKDKSLYPMFSDQEMTPTFADDLAPGIKLLLEANVKGIFHIASPKVTTPFEIAQKAIQVFGGNPSDVKEGSIKEFLASGDQTPRPVKGGLKVGKIESLGFTPTAWDQGIQQIFNQTKGDIL